MRPLTLDLPKPLLAVGEKRLIELHLDNLRRAGIEEVVINVSWLGQKIIDYLGDGDRYGLSIVYSAELEPLETGGALNCAGSLLGNKPVLLVNGDIWTDFPLETLLKRTTKSFHLVMIENPGHNTGGDFSLVDSHIIRATAGRASCTYSGIGVFHPDCIRNYPKIRQKFALREVFEWLIDGNRLTGELYRGAWMDIGTPERLEALQQRFTALGGP